MKFKYAYITSLLLLSSCGVADTVRIPGKHINCTAVHNGVYTRFETIVYPDEFTMLYAEVGDDWIRDDVYPDDPRQDSGIELTTMILKTDIDVYYFHDERLYTLNGQSYSFSEDECFTSSN